MIKYVAMVAVAALAALVASPVSADHCKGKHNNDPGCNGDLGGHLVIQDSIGNILGRWVGGWQGMKEIQRIVFSLKLIDLS